MPIAANRENIAARALWIEGPRQAALRSACVGEPGAGEARIAMLWSGISRGTERLVFEGRVPAAQAKSMRAPFQEGEFPFPVKYGYCAVGRVEAGPAEWLGRTVFCLFPHQSRFIAPLDMLRPVPENIPAAARDARRQYGDRAQRAVGFGRGAGRQDRRDRRRRRRSAGRGALRGTSRRRRDGCRHRRLARKDRRVSLARHSSRPPISPRLAKMTPMSCSTPARARRGWPWRWDAPGWRRTSSR